VPRPGRAKPVPPAMPQAADSDPAAIETPPALTAVEQAFKDWSEAIFEIWWRDYYVDGTTGLDDDYLGSALIEAFVCGESARDFAYEWAADSDWIDFQFDPATGEPWSPVLKKWPVLPDEVAVLSASSRKTRKRL